MLVRISKLLSTGYFERRTIGAASRYLPSPGLKISLHNSAFTHGPELGHYYALF